MKEATLILFLLFCKSFAELDKEWWKHTIIYEIVPFSFKDSDGDGIGDIKGITSKLDYLHDLGIETIHFTPIFDSPMRDMGYDITDYCKIDPRYGRMEDFEELISEMKKRDMKLLLDLVINHSGHEHEWFQKSIDRIDPYTDFYMWKDAKKVIDGKRIPPNKWESFFPLRNPESAWTWNEKRQQFYMHQFLPEQPDLELGNENVKNEIKKIITFWLDKGVAGFRLDAVPNYFEDKQLRDDSARRLENQPETFEFIHELRLFLDEYNNKHGGLERIFLAEAHCNPDILGQYYGNETYPLAHFSYNFILEYIYRPVRSALLHSYIDYFMRYIPKGGVSAWMTQDHDNDRVGSRIVTEYADLFTMISMMQPGVACVYYGQEIGMMNGFITFAQIKDYSGDGTRDPARLSMQWDNSMNAGFSTSVSTFLPMNSDYFMRNVESQKNDKYSQYHMFKDLSALRKTEALKLGESRHETLPPGDIYLLARSFKGQEYVLLVNFGVSSLRVNLTKIAENLLTEVSVAVASTNAGYQKGFILNSELLNGFYMRPLSGVILKIFHSSPKENNS